MSRLTALIHEHFGTNTPGETAADIIVRHIPDTGQAGEVKEIIADAVAVMQGTGLPREEQKKLVTTVVTFALSSLGTAIPPAILSYLVDEAVLLLTGGKSTPAPVTPPVLTTPAPTPQPDPTTIVYPTLDDAKQHLTTGFPCVLERPDGTFSIWPNIGAYGFGKIVWPV